MKSFNKLIILVVLIFLGICGAAFILGKVNNKDNENLYKVELNRFCQAATLYERENGTAPDSLKSLADWSKESFRYVKGFELLDKSLSDSDSMYILYANKSGLFSTFETEKNYYRIDYEKDKPAGKGLIYIVVGICFVVVVAILLVVRATIIKPFNQISDIPYELSKGNLSIPLKESKYKYFGKFIWGLDLLRENLEESRARELNLVKEKKLLLLSLSHDIKTPLSAIKLSATALGKNLYKDEAKKLETTNSINEKVDEIGRYISEIVDASNDDFTNFTVKEEEYYIEDMLNKIKEYYRDKMNLMQIDFKVNQSDNVLVYGDIDRSIEVIQNVVENAIKYGDGNKIWIDVSRENKECKIETRNTGCELEDREIPHMFDSFFRGTNVLNKPGSGLGLYICRKLVHIMEGEIFAKKEHMDNNSVMCVTVIYRIV